MSVLKYMENGEWKGLNIDHASTADSALYDGNGNPIAETYLPRSAGANNPLTGNLHIDSQATEESYLCMYANDAMRGQLWTAGSTGEYPSFYIGAFNGSTQKASIVLNGNSGYMILGADSSNIYLRPNGINDTTNQVIIDTNGQIIGGHPITTKGASKALSASTSSQDIQSFTMTPGTYILISFMDSNTSSTTSYNHIVVVGSIVNKTTRTSMGSGGGCLNGFMFTISENTTCTVQTYVSVACTIRNTVWYTRIS